MTARIFAYIVHKAGVVDDSAAELLAAAKKIDPVASPTAVVVGSGAELDAVCNNLCGSYAEVWKISNDSLAYPNAELIRQALIKVLPQGCFVLVPHNHFGIDLGPGLSIKLNAAFVSDAVAIDGVDGTNLKVVRQEFGGQVSAHVRCNIANGAVINVRPGAFKPVEGATVAGKVVDQSTQVGPLTAKRRYLTTLVPEAGDVDITKEPVLVSVGRGIGEKDNISIAEELAEALGAVVSCSRPVVDAK
ncbi:MAG: FAD-binding protein, partial [Candidatus Korobacteraceae bacterium]